MTENETSEQLSQEPFELTAGQADAGQRLDVWLAAQIPALSRNRIQSLIEEGAVLVDQVMVKARHKIHPGEHILVIPPPPQEPEPKPESIPLDVIYEDADIIVLNKQAGLVTHPAPGHSGGTLVNALLYHCHDLSGIGGVKRPGIVHRLDADTSGLLVAAKNDDAHRILAEAMERREISRRYMAVIAGVPKESSGTIDAPIGRSRTDRKKMSIDSRNGRAAVTHWEVVTWGPGISVLRLKLETGRTHQIRVHLASKMMPIIGDTVYGWARKREMELIPRTERHLIQVLSHVERQMLHAMELELQHPRTGERMKFFAPPPPDVAELIEAIPAQLTQQQLEKEAEQRHKASE